MTHFIPENLHVDFNEDLNPKGDALPRAYTLTPTDPQKDLNLTISREIDEEKITAGYDESLTDQVFATWKNDSGLALHVYVHVNEGLVLGRGPQRPSIFQQDLPALIAAIAYGDRAFILADEARRGAPVLVKFYTPHKAFNKTEDWGDIENFLSQV